VAQHVVALSADLLDRSRLARELAGISFVDRVDMLLAGAGPAPDVVIVDLARHGAAVAALRRALPAARIVCFGPHVDTAAIAAARSAGADAVLSRSRFFHDPSAAVLGRDE
jgi:DNA-binding NarL/FixJ family response regulator